MQRAQEAIRFVGCVVLAGIWVIGFGLMAELQSQSEAHMKYGTAITLFERSPYHQLATTFLILVGMMVVIAALDVLARKLGHIES